MLLGVLRKLWLLDRGARQAQRSVGSCESQSPTALQKEKQNKINRTMPSTEPDDVAARITTELELTVRNSNAVHSSKIETGPDASHAIKDNNRNLPNGRRGWQRETAKFEFALRYAAARVILFCPSCNEASRCLVQLHLVDGAVLRFVRNL